MGFNWSHSTLDTLHGGCAYSVALDKIAKIRPPFNDHPRSAVGTAHHAGIELHEQARLDWYRTGGRAGDRDGVTEVQQLGAAIDALNKTKVDWSRHSYEEARVEVETGLRAWWYAELPKGQDGEGYSLRARVLHWRPIAIEERFVLWSAGVTNRPTVGLPDGVYLDDDGDLLVVDQKQAKHFRNYPMDGSKNRLQAAMYSRAVRQASNFPSWGLTYWPRVEFHIARVETGSNAQFQSARVVTVDPDDGDMRALDERARVADEVVASGEFPKDPNYLCQNGFCGHRVDLGGTCDPFAPPEFSIDVTGQPLPVVRIS